jgi:hypothetical protein
MESSFGAQRLVPYKNALLLTVAFASIVVAGGRGDWNQFVDAGRAMTGQSGWSVFAQHHDVQTGPLSLLIVRLFALTPRNGFVACVLASGVLALYVLAVIERRSTRTIPEDAVMPTLGGVVLLFWWAKLGGYGHLDDAMVLTAGVASTVMVRRGAKLPAAVLLGLSIAVKPWAVILIPITLCRSGSWRKRVEGPLLSVLIGGVLWAPFIVFEPDTLQSMRPTVNVAADSVLRLLGVDGNNLPASLRTVQLLAALAVASVAAWRGRVGGVLLAAVAVRLITDPGTWGYYTPGLVVGALLWETFEAKRRVPWATIAASLFLLPSWIQPSADVRAWLRLVAGVAAVTTVLIGRTNASPIPPTASGERPRVEGLSTSTPSVAEPG